MENLNESKNRMRHLMGYKSGASKDIIQEQIAQESWVVIKDTADNVAEIFGCEKFYEEGKEEVKRIIPNTVKEIGDRFDEVWEKILENFECGDPSDEEFEKTVPDEFKNATDTIDVNESIGRIKQVIGYNTSKILSEQTIINEQGNWWDNKGKVKVFQDWLDANHPDWINNGKGLQKGGGYGQFGPKTTAAWRKYGAEADKQTGLTYTPPKTQTKQVTAKTTDTAFPFTDAEEGNKFRAWVNRDYPSYAKQIDLDSEGSYNNKYIRKAWDKLGDKYLAVSDPSTIDSLKQKLSGLFGSGEESEETTDKPEDKSWDPFGSTSDQCELTGNFLIPVAWPTYQPKVEAGADSLEIWGAKLYSAVTGGGFGTSKTYGEMGHGGIALVQSSGKITLFEFGRYTGHGGGLGITKINYPTKKAKFGADGSITNTQDIASSIRAASMGDGKSMPMEGHIIPVSAEGLQSAYQWANANKKTRKYSAVDLSTSNDTYNCGTFALNTAKAGGIPVGDYCFPDPKAALSSLKKHACNGGSATSLSAG